MQGLGYNQCMIIFKPPHRVEGAPNLSKGMDVFSTAANMATDTIITLDPSSEPIYEETELQLEAIHDKSYVKNVLSGDDVNGYGSSGLSAHTENMHSVLSCAIMHEAALMALKNPATTVFAPVSGFHHAGYDYGGGYCTFNGLVLAAKAVRGLRPNAKVLIIDGDGHWGDGTDNLIDTLRLDWLENCALDKASVAGSYVACILNITTAFGHDEWDLVIYQAGADSHIDDPYYSGYLTDDQWDRRDAMVFKLCREKNIPIVFNLAGGYNGLKTISLHNRTVSMARRVYGEPPRAHLSPLPSP
jgi:acetoin utilization deacetylase AcuC-like enzyme